MQHTLKYIMPAALLTGLLAACTSGTTDGDAPSADCAVKFEAREASRASVITNSTLTANPFAVYGDMVKISGAASTVKIFDGTTVTYSGGAWSYGTPQYWFPGYTYSFVALCPADGLPDISYENNRIAFTYTQPDYALTPDILVATHRRSYTSGTTSAVFFQFRHIMARLNFTAQVDPNAESGIVIESLRLINVFKQGNYQTAPAPLGTGSETDDFVDGSWTVTGDTGVLFEKSFADRVLTPGETLQLFKADEDPLIVIPQQVTSDVKVEITYHHGNAPATKIYASAKLFSIANASHGGKWDAGLSYNYSFSLGANDFVIYSVPEVENWKDAEGGNYVITD